MSEEEKLPAIPSHVVEQFVQTQYQKALNEAEEIRLRSKDIEHQADYAKKLLDYQAQITSNHPTEHRKTVTRYAYIAAFGLVLIFGFLYLCLAMGKDQFITKFLDISSYIIVSALSFYFGRKSANTKNDESGAKTQEAQVIE